MSKTSGIVFDIQRASMQDGPGIRTTVFLKGCPMRCAWCHNPESWTLQPQKATQGDPAKLWGRTMSVDEIIATAVKDRHFYRSGGGITLSGGEPTFQSEFCSAILHEARTAGIHTCLETCGYCPPDTFSAVEPLVDLFLYDIKATGDELHRKLTGVPSALPLQNLERILQRGRPVILRCPLIPGVNDSHEHLAAIAAWAQRYPDIDVEILPYHPSGEVKWIQLGKTAPAFRAPEDPEKAAWVAALHELGVQRVTCY